MSESDPHNSDHVDQDHEHDGQAASRLETEIDLLHAMYPEQIFYERDERKITFIPAAETDSVNPSANAKGPAASLLTLRLPSTYPVTGLPKLLRAADPNGKDITATISTKIQSLSLPEGIETLDEIIATFTDHIASTRLTSAANENNDLTHRIASKPPPKTQPNPVSSPSRTVIIWLHHLLNTSKRKQALSPPSPSVNGIAKPGYPGVLIFSGPAAAVDEHVAELKALNWQAFQVRYDEVEEEEWVFEHGKGVVEVGSMSEVVKGVGEERKAVVMEALRMK